MFGRKRIQKFTDRIHELYDGKFWHIENVINSCITLDQLEHLTRWVSQVTLNYYTYETECLEKLFESFIYVDLLGVVSRYFDLKQRTIKLIIERKAKEILETGTAKEED